jgi:regulatory protein
MPYSSRKNRPRRDGEPATKPKQSAKSYIIWLLSKREYSASELHDKLSLRGYEDEEMAGALEFAQSHNFQSDERFARVKTQSFAARLGNRRIAHTLQSNGITSEMVAEQLEKIEPEDGRAIRVAARFKGKPLTTPLYAKVQRFLLYRGFSSGAVKAAIAWLRENQAPESEVDEDDLPSDTDDLVDDSDAY